jgi:membrane protein insertase Oxa1/YidC/SpoIIIJ
MYRYLESIGHTPASNGTIQLLNKITHLWNTTPEVFDNIKNSCANPDVVLQKIADIANPENALNFKIGAVDFGEIPTFDFSSVNAWLLLIPVLTFVIYFFSMRINRKLSFQPTQNADERQQACSNNMMDVTMPLMSVYITFIVPAAIGVYWMFKSILGVVKQFVLSKLIPLPQFTEEDYKAAEKEILGKQPKKIQKSENAGKVRSLHHIDDEDYDEHGNFVPKIEKEDEDEDNNTTLPENKMTEGATLKDESDKKTHGDNKND